MKKETAHIIVILDRSGSMETIRKDAIGGFNSFVAAQKKLKINSKLTLVQFDDKYELNYESKPIKEVEDLTTATFIPRGGTALHDALGKTISTMKEKIPKKDKAVFVIITDGQENASKEYSSDTVKKLIEDNKQWEFTFIGSNQDAILAAKAYAIPINSAVTFANNATGTRNVMASMSMNVSSYLVGSTAKVTYSAEDRLKAVEE